MLSALLFELLRAASSSSYKTQLSKKLVTLLDLCVSSLRRGHANLLCIVPILSDDPRRESNMTLLLQPQPLTNATQPHTSVHTNHAPHPPPLTMATYKPPHPPPLTMACSQPLLRQSTPLPPSPGLPLSVKLFDGAPIMEREAGKKGSEERSQQYMKKRL